MKVFPGDFWIFWAGVCFMTGLGFFFTEKDYLMGTVSFITSAHSLILCDSLRKNT